MQPQQVDGALDCVRVHGADDGKEPAAASVLGIKGRADEGNPQCKHAEQL